MKSLQNVREFRPAGRSESVRLMQSRISDYLARQAASIAQEVEPPVSPSVSAPAIEVVRRPNGKVAAQFHALAGRMLTMRAATSAHCVAIASYRSRKAADYVAFNLASSLSYFGKRVILVDADFRSNRLAVGFRLGDRSGLKDILANKATIQESIVQSSTPNLSLLPVGSASIESSALLASEGLSDTFADLKERFDYVIALSAPHGDVSDGQFVWVAAGQVFVVVRRHADRIPELAELSAAFRSTGVESVGSTLVG